MKLEEKKMRAFKLYTKQKIPFITDYIILYLETLKFAIDIKKSIKLWLLNYSKENKNVFLAMNYY